MTFLGFDFGMKNIGVAIGQTISCTAQPLVVLKAQDGIPDWRAIQSLIDEWLPNALIVGLPYGLQLQEQSITFSARKFARRLKAAYHLPVHLVDERLTTKEARRLLREQGNHAAQVVGVLMRAVARV